LFHFQEISKFQNKKKGKSKVEGIGS